MTPSAPSTGGWRRVGRARQVHRLRPGQPSPVLDQLLEPVPGGAVRQHERVDVHPAKANGRVAFELWQRW
ncbi:hypothetical protein I553_3793 [Mycobacterium xenopi 4042]|uniref:Uncharacterized protein n=1 Tax=Mycobacterium xenopi 4042 TaxID=1299334 RepID=X8EXX4_MYCXE|nr:hypothetical protein I552_3334 [Mycobacterium xenopi 3993]EUA78616.1 hypothetical protein I553_2906 [Mycobacterium xenopi 4042]EUA85006.1 hypothetical protein I553_3793 [Mycobacterium xenopi 4042]